MEWQWTRKWWLIFASKLIFHFGGFCTQHFAMKNDFCFVRCLPLCTWTGRLRLHAIQKTIYFGIYGGERRQYVFSDPYMKLIWAWARQRFMILCNAQVKKFNFEFRKVVCRKSNANGHQSVVKTNQITHPSIHQYFWTSFFRWQTQLPSAPACFFHVVHNSISFDEWAIRRWRQTKAIF